MIQNLIFSLGLSFAFGLTGVKDNNHNFINNDNLINVVYDENNNQVTLSLDELSYTYSNLTTLFENHLSDYTETTLIYNSGYFSPDFADDVRWADGNGNVIVLDDNFSYYVSSDLSDFEFSITIDCSNDNYADVSNAVALDISANSGSTPSLSDFQSILNAIISLLVGGITGMASGLGSGINSTISALAIENGSMSIFLGVVAIFGGIALAVGLTRRIFAWIQNLGGRN